MKYIDFESWTITWLHEGNVIVEDQLTHNFKRRSRTAPPNTQKQYLELLVNGFVRGAWSVSISVELSQHKCANGLTVCGYF